MLLFFDLRVVAVPQLFVVSKVFAPEGFRLIGEGVASNAVLEIFLFDKAYIFIAEE